MTPTHHYTERETALAEIASERRLDEDAFLIYCDNFHIDADDPDMDSHIQEYEESYQGQYDDFLAFATDFMNDTMDIPDFLANYIDYEAFARDLRHDYWEEQGYVFRNI